MTVADERPPDCEKQRDSLSHFSEACIRISENLDVGAVLQEVIDSACSLTDARYGALITFDDSGGMENLVISGITPEEQRRMGDLPMGLGILGYLDEIEGPLRLRDIVTHHRSVGFPENHPPMKTFLGSPVQYQGERLGNIYLTEKDGGREFSREDEDILVLFTSQVALVVANARRHREERQASADLEALLNISPVGVLVFDAKTGDLLSVNEETNRIFGQLNAPRPSLSQILEVITIRTPGGREIPTDELPTTRAVRNDETVFADEVVIHLQGGRTVSTLVNARPIHREDGDILSVVATIQDVTPLEEVKRQRAEFLRNVSHELRTPLSAIKGSTSTLLSSPYPLDSVETRQFLRVIDEQSDHMGHLINDLVDMTQIEAGTLSVNPEPTDVVDLLGQAREAHIHAGAANNSVELDLPPDLPRVLSDGRRVLQVLGNLLASVSRYSSKSSTVRIGALLRDVYVAVTVDNEGAGAATPRPPRQLGMLSRTADKVAGRRNGKDDLGIAISVGIIEAHGGRLLVEEGEEGRGSGFTFTLPVVDEAAYLAEQGSARSPSARDPLGGRARILAVGANPETRRYIRNTLSQAGFIALVTGDPDETERLIEAQNPHAVLLEPTLPWADGFELLVRVGRISDAPVIFVAGPGWDWHIGRAFELGAFDYIAKPFTSTELVARVQVALRKRPAAGGEEALEPYLHANLAIDYAGREVTVAGRSVRLTATEYKLLVELSTSAGRVLTHEQLLRRVWGPLYTSDSRIVRTYVKELRHKLGDDAASPTYIFTEPGVGYRMSKLSTD